ALVLLKGFENFVDRHRLGAVGSDAVERDFFEATAHAACAVTVAEASLIIGEDARFRLRLLDGVDCVVAWSRIVCPNIRRTNIPLAAVDVRLMRPDYRRL